MNTPAHEEHRMIAEFMLAICTLAVAVGVGGLIEGDGHTVTLAATAIGAHLVALVLRRSGIGVFTSILASFAALVVLSTMSWYPETAIGGILPGLDTLSLVRTDLGDAWRLFSEEVAPVPGTTGLVFIAAFGIWFAATLSDWAGFRIGSPVEALIPAATLFVFTSILDHQPYGARLLPSLVALASALLFVLFQRQSMPSVTPNWLGGQRAGARSLALVGTGVVASSLIAGVAITPILPWAEAEPLVNLNEGDGDDTREVKSPLVDIQSRLVDLQNEEMLTVTTTDPAYIRLTALSKFDGQVWNIPKQQFPPIEDGLINSPAASRPESDRTRFQVNVGDLDQPWAPVVNEPARVLNSTTELSYHAETAAMIVSSSVSNGASYELEVVQPTQNADQLRAAPQPQRGPLYDLHTELPANFPATVIETALNATAGSGTQYDQMLALQNFFTSEFVYDLNVDNGHGSSAIETFLAQRAGYCEQFSATFAAMARTLGYPSRVVVGFTQGEPVAGQADTFSVKGLNAHAWPEVYFEGIGWVGFEPTPGRGNPSSVDHTQREPRQASPDDPNQAESTATTTTVAPTPTTIAGTPPTTAPAFNPGGAAPAPPPPGGGGGDADSSLPGWLRWFGLLAVVGACYLGLVLGAPALRRQRRQAAATTPERRVELSWTQALEQLALVGMVRRSEETAAEFTDRARRTHPDLAEPLASLAEGHTLSMFAPETCPTEVVRESEQSQGRIRAWVNQRLGTKGRIVAAIHPRNVMGNRVLGSLQVNRRSART